MEKKTKIIKNNDRGIQKLRFIIQTLFALLCIWIGIELYLFIKYLETNGAAAFFTETLQLNLVLPKKKKLIKDMLQLV